MLRTVFVLSLAVLASLATVGRGSVQKPLGVPALSPALQAEALPMMIAANYLGLGAEAAQIDAWMRSHPAPFSLDGADPKLRDAADGHIKVTAQMALTLNRLNQWYGLAAPADRPITHQQLQSAALSPASVDHIRKIFESAIRRGVSIGGRWFTPEVGGEATIDSDLRFAEALDPRWSTVQDLVGAAAANDPKTLAALYEGRRTAIAQVDSHDLLKLAVARFRLGAHAADAEMRRAVSTVAENAAATYSHDPEQQFALIASSDWRGRYVGRWHTHSPHQQGGDWAGGDAPSFEDMQNAVRDGQYLTLAFQPDGFDLYDAAPLADAQRVDLTLLKVIRYRSPSWRAHFKRLLPGGP